MRQIRQQFNLIYLVGIAIVGGMCWSVIPILVRELPADDQAPETPAELPLTAADRDHWAFRPLVRPDIPVVQARDWCRTPIDTLILSRMEAAGLTTQPVADRLTLLRRVTFDVTGLPPGPADVANFVSDELPEAYDRLVDRLLASPAYGERWGQHWLDLARFAETDGFEHDLERPHAWRYRDWVIDALNRDLPYDQFIKLQLAGDELQSDDADALVATGFLLCGPDMPDINLAEERRHNFLNDLTGTVGATLLGLQVGCAQCHDHKYDPVSQHDFYRLRACFDPVDIFRDHALPLPPGAAAASAPASRLKLLEADAALREEVARQRLRAENPDLQPTRDDIVRSWTLREKADNELQIAEIQKLREIVKANPAPLGRVVREQLAGVRPSRLYIRGDFRREGAEVVPAFPRIANREGVALHGPAVGAVSTGRRTQLADWLTHPAHPLAMRVIVNRLWQHHFGRGLVETSSDFGKMGAEPSHPELLDWLATEFSRQGFSLKRLHKLMLTSAVYRQASRPAAIVEEGAIGQSALTHWKQSLLIDPENRLWSRMPRQRLEGEAIRDAMLVAAGRLNSGRGGPGVRPPLPAELVATLLKDQWKVSPDEADHRRRSIYLFVRRNLRFPLFEAFDRPDTNASCPRRNRSTIAPQALILLNSEFTLTVARDLAGIVLEQAGSSADRQIELAYVRTLGRSPTADERAIAEQFLASQAEALRSSGRPAAELAIPTYVPADIEPFAAAALTDFCLALFNLNEFVYVD